MNTIKKLWIFVLVLAMTMGLLMPVQAAEISLNQAQSVTVVNDEIPVIFRFIPAKTSYYSFYSFGSQNCDPYGYILDANQELLVQGDDTENTLDFSMSCYMTAGNTYYLAATCYSGSAQYQVMLKALSSATSMVFDRETYTGSLCGQLYPEITFYPVDSARETITLSSSNEKIVRIGEDGEFYLGTPGTATVTATSETGLTASCTVNVAAPATIPLDTPWTLDASLGEQYLQFSAPSDGWYGIHSSGDEIDPWVEVLDKDLEGISGDDETLPNGNFFAPFYLEKGELCYFGFNTADCHTGTAQVMLQKLNAATAIHLSCNKLTGYAGTECLLTPVYEPQISVPETLTFQSSNENVVCVDEFGNASLLAPGNAVVTVTSKSGKSDSVAVTVLAAPSVTGLTAWGNCGPNLQWQLKSGVLTVTGSGEMYSLHSNSSHWDDYSSQIKQVQLPAGITGIGYGAFQDCTALTEISIPEGVRRIDSGAFRNCYALKRVTLPNSLNHLGQSVFDYCFALNQINLPEGLKRIPNAAFRNCSSLSSVTLPGSVESIGDEAFSGCAIAQLTLPRSLKTLGYAAFASTGLTQITLPEGLTEIRDYALVNCFLEELTVPASVAKVGKGFATGNELHTIRFLGSAPHFDSEAFHYLQVTAYYPAANRSWTAQLLNNYGGTVTWIPEGKPGANLSGTADPGVTLTLTQGNTLVETVASQKGAYTVTNLQPGTYTLTATAHNHVSRVYTVTVTDQDTVQNVKLHLIGDVDGSGKINVGDVSKLLSHIRGVSLITDPYLLECANVNGGKLNMGDISSLYAHIRGTKKLY